MADGVADSSNIEQLTIYLRWLDKTTKNRESDLGLRHIIDN